MCDEKRFKHLIGDHIKRGLYNAFILPAFNYCSDIWHFCSKRSKDKLEQLNEQALRTVLNSNLDYETYLRIIGSVSHYVQYSSWNCSTISQITTESTNNSVQPYMYPKIESTKSYYNLLWITIVHSMEYTA